jgi:hypothetical protein
MTAQVRAVWLESNCGDVCARVHAQSLVARQCKNTGRRCERKGARTLTGCMTVWCTLESTGGGHNLIVVLGLNNSACSSM